MMTEKTYLKIERVAGIAVLLFSILFFIFKYSYHLFFAEQMQLFLLTPQYFFTYLAKPAVLARYIGDFLTQFYYLRGGGSLVLTANLFLLWMLVRRILKYFSKEKTNSVFALLPVLAALALHTQIDYSLSSTIAIILTLFFLLLLFQIQQLSVRRLIGIVLIPIVYWATGAGVILFSILFALFELKNPSNNKWLSRLFIVFILLAGLLTPLFLRSQFLLTTKQALLFPQYPLSEMNGWVFSPVLSILLIVLVKQFLKTKRTVWTVITELSLLLAFGIMGIVQNANFKLEKIFSIDSELYFNHLERASELADKYQLTGSVGNYFSNLIASKKNCLAEEMANGRQAGIKGLFLPINHTQNYRNITFSNEVYYHLGDVNAAQHSALLGIIFSPKSESSRLMRRLVEINIINGEFAAAGKFIRMLEKSLFHKKWAVAMRKYLNNEALCEKTPWIVEKRKMRPLSDKLKGTNDIEKTLKLLLERDPKNSRVIDYLCCYYLFQKDIDRFADFFLDQDPTYLRQPSNYFQEALLIEYTKKPHSEIWDKVGISNQVAARFKTYTEAFSQYKGDGSALQENFKSTYWFYYDYAIINRE